MTGAQPRPRLGIVALALVGLCLGGWYLETRPAFSEAVATLQEQAVPAQMLRYGGMGEILRNQELVEPEWNDGRFPRTTGYNPPATASVFAKKRQVGETLLRAQRYGVASEQPPLEIPESEVFAGWPTISLEIDPHHLYDPDTGIVPNWDDDWEKPGRCGVFMDGELVFESECGVRLHGNTTRNGDIMRERGNAWRSFRLYFRSDFGLEFMPGNLIFDEEASDQRTLIVRGNSFISSGLSYDMARMLGTRAPRVRLVNFLINGKKIKAYTATEHLSRRQTEAQFGHSDFLFYKVHATYTTPEATRAFRKLRDWSRKLPSDVSRSRVSHVIDLDDYCRHMFVILYTGSSDWGEGACIKDMTHKRPLWRWTMWDMDNAFRVPPQQRLLGRTPKEWSDCFLGHALTPPDKAQGYPRAAIFRRLFTTHWFPLEFAELCQDIINHELTTERLHATLTYYTQLAAVYDAQIGPTRSLKQLIDKRPVDIRRDLQAKIGLGSSVELKVEPSIEKAITIDGHEYTSTYTGWHFPDFELELDVPKHTRREFDYWLVNGERTEGRSLSIAPTEGLEVVAVFKQRD